MELQELVERIQRWKERTFPEENSGYAAEEEAEVQTDEMDAELLDNDFVEEVSETDIEVHEAGAEPEEDAEEVEVEAEEVEVETDDAEEETDEVEEIQMEEEEPIQG